MADAKTSKQQQNVYSDFLKAFRAYKQRKREWQEAMQVKLAQEEEEIRRKREALYAELV